MEKQVVQKLWLQGSSVVITVPRKMMLWLNAEPGDFLEFMIDDQTERGTVRVWGREVAGRSPGVIQTDPPKVQK